MSKLLFDATGSANVTQEGWVKIGFYDRDLYNVERTRGVKEKVQKLALNHRSGIMVWDIEHWPVSLYAEQLIEIIDWAREVRPELRQGYYGLLPERNYWGPVLHSIRAPRNSYESWVANNQRNARHLDASGKPVSRGLIDAVDFVCPSLYTFYMGKDGNGQHESIHWHTYAKYNIEEARKYQKPIYPWLWPHLHPSNPRGVTKLSDQFFRTQIETCLQHADGVAIYDSATITPKFDLVPIMNEFAVRNAAGEFDLW